MKKGIFAGTAICLLLCEIGSLSPAQATGLIADDGTKHSYWGIFPVFRVASLPFLKENNTVDLGYLTGDTPEKQVEEAIQISNTQCSHYLSDIGMSERVWNTATTVLSIGFSAVGSTAKYAGTTKRMAAGTTSALALKAVGKDQALGGSSTYLLSKALQKRRKQLAKDLRAETSGYDIEEALPAIIAYHASCTLNEAFIAINEAVSEKDDDRKSSDKPQAPVSASSSSSTETDSGTTSIRGLTGRN